MVERLRPGYAVSRRDETSLQVGLDHRAVLAYSAETLVVLRRLEQGLPVSDLSAAEDVLAQLRAHDLLVDAAQVDRGAPEVFTAYGTDASRRVAARAAASASVLVLGAAVEGDAWDSEVVGMLASSGIPAAAHEDSTATVAVVLCAGEPEREQLDTFIVTGQPHVLVVAHEGAVRVGPFVRAGSTACVRCVDAHLDERDGRRGVVLRQIAGRAAPVDAATRTAASALAVRDVVAFVDGDRPVTWSATTTLGPRPGSTHQDWRRHPHCGCCWGDLLDGWA